MSAPVEDKPTILKRSGLRAATFRACVPIEPVLPKMTMRRVTLFAAAAIPEIAIGFGPKVLLRQAQYLTVG